jgi:type IV secretory pathway VirB4 component
MFRQERLQKRKNNMATKPSGATQQFVPVKEIKNGVIVLKDGSYRGILICSAINFGLKSADEQHAIILGFQNFLNTLDFSIQIVINSRKMDLRPYLSMLEGKEPDQKTELLKIQLREYIEFIRSFAEQANIMTKSFYIVVPYSAHTSPASAVNFLKRGNSSTKSAAAETSFEESRVQLEQRLALIIGGLSGSGVRAVPLDTEEVVELLYRSFNPGELENPIRLDN